MSNSESFDVIIVADGQRTSLGVALAMVVAKKCCPGARFHVAKVLGSKEDDDLSNAVIEEYAHRIFNIPPPSVFIDGRIYRIINKVNAMICSDLKRAVSIDSDIMFLRPLPTEFVFRNVPTVVPEHGLHEFPWPRLFALANLRPPEIKVLLGGGIVADPWFNAGLISVPDATQFGHIWRMMCDLLLTCEWVPERWPYLDQIALPLALAQVSVNRTITQDNVLPGVFNQNLFSWMKDQSHVRAGYVVHHHSKTRLIERYFGDLIMWTRGEYPIVDKIISAMRPLDVETKSLAVDE